MAEGEKDLRVAVVTGYHTFDVPAFHDMLAALPGVHAYVQDLENLAADTAGAWVHYDAFVFYNMHAGAPEGRVRERLERLGTTSQGITVLHHGLLAFPDWPVWDEVTGLQDRGNFHYLHNQAIRLTPAAHQHPIIAGLAPWTVTDETYSLSDAGGDCQVLVTTDHADSMRTIAWTRSWRQARVCCLELGHDALAWSDEGFRVLLGHGIRWTARRP